MMVTPQSALLQAKETQHPALSPTALHCPALHALHGRRRTAPPCRRLNCAALRCPCKRCVMLRCCPAECCIALHCIELHCITLHGIAWHRTASHPSAPRAMATPSPSPHLLTPSRTSVNRNQSGAPAASAPPHPLCAPRSPIGGGHRNRRCLHGDAAQGKMAAEPGGGRLWAGRRNRPPLAALAAVLLLGCGRYAALSPSSPSTLSSCHHRVPSGEEVGKRRGLLHGWVRSLRAAPGRAARGLAGALVAGAGRCVRGVAGRGFAGKRTERGCGG